MPLILSHKIRLKPNNKQVAHLKHACDVSRFVYNWALNQWQRMFEAGEKPSANKIDKRFNQVKKQSYPWVLDVSKSVPQIAIKNLGQAFKRFFNKQSKYPHFKRKNKCKNSFGLQNNQFDINNKIIRLPKLGNVRIYNALHFSGKIMSATISQTADRWFVSITVEVDFDPSTIRHENQGLIGIDVGLNSFAVLSTGHSFDAPKPLKHALRQLKTLNKKLSRQIRLSNNWKKTKQRIAKLYYRISCIRNDFLHKLTSFLTQRFNGIAIENLNIKGMLRNHRLARSISDVAWSEFRRQLEYKAELYGSEIAAIDRWFPSTQTCSNCGERKQGNEKLKLGDKFYHCDHCGFEANRDFNAAINIRNQGFNLESADGLSAKKPVASLVNSFNASVLKPNHDWAGSFHGSSVDSAATMQSQRIQ